MGISFLKSISACIKISWNSSRIYTIIRFIGRGLIPATSVAVAYTAKKIVDVLTLTEPDKSMIIFWCALSAIIYIFQSLIQKIINYIEYNHSELIQKEITNKLMNKITNADMEMFDNSNYYDKFFTANREQSALSNALWNIIDVISTFVSFIVITIFAFKGKRFYALLIVITSIPSAIIGQYYTKKLYDLNLKQVNNERKKNYIYRLTIDKTFCQEVKLLDLGEFLINKFNALWFENYNEKKHLTKRRITSTALFDSIPEIAILIVMIALALKVINKDDSIGDYTFYTSLIIQTKLAVYTIVNELFLIRSNKLKIENIFDFFKIENKVINNGKLKLKKIKSIEFVNASFRYPCTKQNAVSNINLQINNMDKICIVGLNGAGKSTLIKLLLRFYDVDSGEILINGKNIKKYDIKSLRYCFGCYFQNSINYGFTLFDNIKFGNLSYCDDLKSCYHALSTADGADILSKCSGDMKVYIGRAFDNNGIELSGGQHQKLALARTIYRNSQVLILDEPSSNLDPKAENSFFVSLKNMTKSKTVIFTSHRLSNIDLAKKIVVMKDGCITDIGTKNELLNRSALFSEMYNIQADKYKSKA